MGKISDENYELVERELNNIKDLDLLILKGHTFIEYYLNEYLSKHCCSQYNLDFMDEKFSFYQRARLFYLFDRKMPVKEREIMFKIMIQLNSLRNNAAHNIITKNKIKANNLIDVWYELKQVLNEGYDLTEDRIEFNMNPILEQVRDIIDMVVFHFLTDVSTIGIYTKKYSESEYKISR